MKSYLTHAVTALVTCVLALTGYGTLYATISTKSAAVATLQNAIDAKTEVATRVASARSALAETAADEVLMQAYFVPETGVVSFIDNLQAKGTALESVVTVSSVETAGTDMAPTLILVLALKGSFDAVMRTIGAIEYAPHDLSILDFSLRQNDKTLWHADVKLRVGSVPAPPANSTP